MSDTILHSGIFIFTSHFRRRLYIYARVCELDGCCEDTGMAGAGGRAGWTFSPCLGTLVTTVCRVTRPSPPKCPPRCLPPSPPARSHPHPFVPTPLPFSLLPPTCLQSPTPPPLPPPFSPPPSSRSHTSALTSVSSCLL